MNFNNTYLAVLLSFISLFGCGGGGENSSPVPMVVEPVVTSAAISSLNITTELTEQGQMLRATISCTYCLAAKHQYSWFINDALVSDTDSYGLTSDDLGKEIRIEVSVDNDKNQADTAYKIIIASRSYVTEIFSISGVFSALKSDGTVVTWGLRQTGSGAEL